MKTWHTLRTDNLRRRLQQSVSTWFRSASRSSIKAGLDVDPGATPTSSDPTPEAAARNFAAMQFHIDPTSIATEVSISKSALRNTYVRSGSVKSDLHGTATDSNPTSVSQADSQLSGPTSWIRLLKSSVQTMQTGQWPVGSNSPLASGRGQTAGPAGDSPDHSRRPINSTATPQHNRQFTNRLGSIPSDLQQPISPGSGGVRQPGPSAGPQPPDPIPIRNQPLNPTHYGITLQRTVQANQEPRPSVVARPIPLPVSASDTTHNAERPAASAYPEQGSSSTGPAPGQMQPAVRPVTPFLPIAPSDMFTRSSSDLDKKREARTNARARSMLPRIR